MRYWLFRVKISGESMWPDLVPGQSYWATSLFAPKVGRIVIAQHPENNEMLIIKKVTAVSATTLELSGVHRESKNYTIMKNAVLGTLVQ